jgi:hypothetical protein
MRPRQKDLGTGVLEVLFTLALVAIVAASAAALGGEWRGRLRALAAARLVANQVRLARVFALEESRHVALVFRRRPGADLWFQMHRDGNNNGVRQAETQSGTDPPVGSAIRLSDWFAGTSLAIPRDLPPIDQGPRLAAGSDPVKLSGGTAVLSCGPGGTATAGTIYIAGPRGEAFAVRVLGPTGRLRIFEYSDHAGGWEEQW